MGQKQPEEIICKKLKEKNFFQMKVLIAIPHVFKPTEGSVYSSQKEEKRETKLEALKKGTTENLDNHGAKAWIHASLGYRKPIVTRELRINNSIDLTIQLYTPPNDNLAGSLAKDPRLKIIDPKTKNYLRIPSITTQRLLEQADNYDIVGYMEDDLSIEDKEFFNKLIYIHRNIPEEYAITPHRCEYIEGKGDVILSGDPDGGRSDLFWDTGEAIKLKWPTGDKVFYRATNPHSGCYFLSRVQAIRVRNYWEKRKWTSEFELSGPLEQAASGTLLPLLKIMKPRPEDYRFLYVRHQDSLWKRHPFEETGNNDSL